MEKQLYLLDRTKVTSLTFNEADDHLNYWLKKTEDERLNAACFIINQIFGVTPQTKVDRTITDKRKQP
jgi:translation initiation factor 2B subunit (eIF-2B alpha/beta/delta family)